MSRGFAGRSARRIYATGGESLGSSRQGTAYDLGQVASKGSDRAGGKTLCQALGKRHPRQNETLQFTRRNFWTIRSDPDRGSRSALEQGPGSLT